ncbi:MAG: glycosyl transferase family 2 [Flavobacterium sp.]|uniref:glycosyltransferase n=1 Tax=Flavobacterium sp. TaxID=239 RepID=UPI000C38AAC1|nr:glycosyltransferase [Flavobacterium sp.]MBF02841.1 glycosyl transferase family 2 [Flavobacterium sp.]
MLFSFIIPVYNRPEEIEELLQSMTHFDFKAPFEVVIVEDGSSVPCEHIVENYKNRFQISYYFKSNSGPGNSRNFGMQKAKGDYFIILDSDCILPKEYLTVVSQSLQNHYVDCFGGPDKALPTFSNIQKAINFSMTSFLTTGGIRGGSEKVDKFQPRSFNMGLSKNAFEISKGFGNIHPGEDPDLSIRLWELGLQTKLLKEAYVYHKRRIDWNKFYIQVNKFGKARPILNFWYPKYTKLTFWFPSFFLFGFVLSLILILFSLPILFYLYLIYFGMIFVSSLVQNKSATIAVYSIIATAIQFYGYGIGYLKSFINVFFLKKKPQQAHPELFF